MPLGREAYVDAALFAVEHARVFGRGWSAAAHVADLERAGAWARVPFAGANLVVARTAELGLSAIVDTCGHRGTLLLDGDAGRCASLAIECPYHGWTYDLSGALVSAPGMAPSFRKEDHPLSKLGVRERLGVVFTSFDSGAAPPALPPWLEALERAHVPLRRAHRTVHSVHANWKLLIQNFQEAHHFPRIHPGLERLTPSRASSSLRGAGWLGGTMALTSETVSMSGRAGARPFLVPEGPERRVVRDALVLPNLLTSLQPDYLLTYRIHPEAVDRTRVVAEVHFHAATRPSPDDDDVFAFWDRTNAEDRAICERQQRGISGATSWRPSDYATSEDGLRSFDAWLAEALAP